VLMPNETLILLLLLFFFFSLFFFSFLIYIIAWVCHKHTLSILNSLSLSFKAPGGRSNAKMITKSTFKEFSSPHPDGNYFLRPDRILGVFHIELDNGRNLHLPLATETSTTVTTAEMMVEKNRELKVNQVFELADSKQISNTLRIDDAIALIWAEAEKKKNMNMENMNMKITNSSSSSTSQNSHSSSSSSKSLLPSMSSSSSSSGELEQQESSSSSAMSKDIEMNVKMQHTTTTSVKRDENHGSSQGETYNQMLNISPLIQEAPTYI
jgi:hypothetical protein